MASHTIWLILFFISPIICGVIASILFHLKHKRTSSSSTATCPPDSAPPSSSSVDDPKIKYDVFLSFRGIDTRSSFLSHLLKELSQKKIDYFVDGQKINKGDEISSTLLSAIKKSEISLVVFSEDYANSKWCLEELEQIIECMENQKQIVIPIFYKVDPATVRHQKGSYKKAFNKLGKRFEKHRLQKWQTALKKATDLSGFDSSSYNTEATLVKEVVERVLTALNQTRDENDLKGLVGIHQHIQYLKARLCAGSQDIFIIGIWGMGGIGKTTIAEILYNRLHNEYEGSHFLHVREELDKHKSITQLKKDLLSKLLEEDLHNVMLSDIPMYVKRRLCRKKILVVLDDVSDSNHPEILAGGHEWFGSGSRIIITSRDKHVLSKECDEIYPIEPLNSKEALQLFENVLTEDCLVKKHERYKLSEEVVNYAKGVPLVIKVLGRFLYDKNKDEWESKLVKLGKMPDSKIQDVLELSYNELDDNEHKDIFLYLACFFREESKERITNLLDACGYHTIDGLRVLQDKALITISCGIVSMHDLIQVMGCEIVHKNSPKDLGQRSHLCDSDDIYKFFENKMGTGTIESVRLNILRLKKDLHLGPKAVAGMDNLRLLQFDKDWQSENRYMVYPPEEGFESLPNELRSFHWESYPLKSLPLRSCVDNLVELRFCHSKLQRLWDGVQNLPCLQVLDLSYSRELVELPDLSKAPNLGRLHLASCERLRQVSLTSHGTEESEEDDHLDLCGTSLAIKPSVKYYVLPSLQWLNLRLCGNITELPDNINLYLPSLKRLEIWGTKVETLPTSIKHLSQLTFLGVEQCSRLRYIPKLPPSIENFSASDCGLLETLQFTSNSMPLSHQKHELFISLYNCVKLGEHTLEAVAMHYKLTTEKIVSANRKDSYASLYFSGSKIPECFSSYWTTQESVSVPLELPLYSKAMGFIFYFVLLPNKCQIFVPDIKCYIELSNVAKELSINDLGPRPRLLMMESISDQVLFWYGGFLSLKIMEEVSRIKASATTDVLCPKIWFELLDNKFECLGSVKEWGVYPIFISSEPQDLFQH